MINRVLIRIKVLQILFSLYQNDSKSFDAADKELFFSIEKAYDLYFYLILLGVDITRQYEKRIDIARNKFLPTAEERNPNLRLANNKLIKAISTAEPFVKHTTSKKLSWNDEEPLLRSLLDDILASIAYKEYIASPTNDFEEDRELWIKIYKQQILKSDDLADVLEDQSIYWNDDLDIVGSFVVKTLKKFNPENPEEAFLPMFKESSDSEYAKTLFRSAYLKSDEYRAIIGETAQNWNLDRLAFMDMLILQMAIAEMLNFPSIPVTVTMNEYIELAKYYSTEKSCIFVNGILDKVASNLREQGKIFK